jgi:surfeit locus 1 family protein
MTQFEVVSPERKPPSHKKIIVGIILLLIVGLVCISLGRWQLSRADERIAIAQSIEAGRAHPPIKLNSNTPQAELIDWRSAKVEGHWATQFTVLLDNRNLDGRPGYWVATPFVNTDGSAVLVLRGWLPRLIAPLASDAASNQTVTSTSNANTKPKSDTLLNGKVSQLPSKQPPQLSIKTTTSLEQVIGEMTPHVPRLFELKADPTLNMAPLSAFTKTLNTQNETQTPPIIEADIRQLPTLQNLQLDVLAQVTGLKLLPIVLKQTSSSPDGLVRQWAGPSIDSDTNKGYAMQWFVFAAIAIIAALVLGWRGLKHAKI